MTLTNATSARRAVYNATRLPLTSWSAYYGTTSSGTVQVTNAVFQLKVVLSLSILGAINRTFCNSPAAQQAILVDANINPPTPFVWRASASCALADAYYEQLPAAQKLWTVPVTLATETIPDAQTLADARSLIGASMAFIRNSSQPMPNFVAQLKPNVREPPAWSSTITVTVRRKRVVSSPVRASLPCPGPSRAVPAWVLPLMLALFLALPAEDACDADRLLQRELRRADGDSEHGCPVAHLTVDDPRPRRGEVPLRPALRDDCRLRLPATRVHSPATLAAAAAAEPAPSRRADSALGLPRRPTDAPPLCYSHWGVPLVASASGPPSPGIEAATPAAAVVEPSTYAWAEHNLFHHCHLRRERRVHAD